MLSLRQTIFLAALISVLSACTSLDATQVEDPNDNPVEAAEQNQAPDLPFVDDSVPTSFVEATTTSGAAAADAPDPKQGDDNTTTTSAAASGSPGPTTTGPPPTAPPITTGRRVPAPTPIPTTAAPSTTGAPTTASPATTAAPGTTAEPGTTAAPTVTEKPAPPDTAGPTPAPTTTAPATTTSAPATTSAPTTATSAPPTTSAPTTTTAAPTTTAPTPTTAPPSTPPGDYSCTIHVDDNGSDSNSGNSSAQAYASISKAASVVSAGDTVCVYPGTYSEFTNSANGTVNARIHYVSVEKWAAKVTSSASRDAVIIQNGEYTDIEGFEVTATNQAITAGIINGNNQHASHSRIFGNYVHDVAKTATSGAGIVSAGWRSDSRFQGVDVEIFNNWVHDAGGNYLTHGIYVSHPYAKVYNNIVHDTSGWCIHGWHNPNHIEVTNNYCENNWGIVMSEGGGDGTMGGVGYVITNNVLVNNDRAMDIRGQDDIISHNAFFNTPTNNGTNYGDNAIVGGSAGFAGGAAPEEFKPNSGSQLVDAGLATYAPGFGFAGSSRGGSPDIGAYES